LALFANALRVVNIENNTTIQILNCFRGKRFFIWVLIFSLAAVEIYYLPSWFSE
jgi:hypothetical protein